ncbi:MAG: hypothetical protein NTY38_25415 [Acidobacteria bacterium]|nr:hypothetical protein [Acidobacteriota bacterium]
MAALALVNIQEPARFGHEAGQDLASLLFMAGPEVEAEAHPVQFQAIEVVASGQFLDQAEVVAVDLGVGVVEGAVGEAGEAVGDAAELGIAAPELAVEIVVLIVGVVDIPGC